MWTYTAQRRVDASAATVRATVERLVAANWASSRVHTTPDRLSWTDAVGLPGGEAADSWLSWELKPLAGGIELVVVLDEVEPGPDATGDLRSLLDRVAAQSEQHEVSAG